MNGSFLFLLLVSLTFVSGQSNYYTITLDSSSVKDGKNREVSCLGTNSNLTDLTFSTSIKTIEAKGDFYNLEINGITTMQLIEEEKSTIYPLKCMIPSTMGYLHCKLLSADPLKVGTYKVSVPEKAASGIEMTTYLEIYLSNELVSAVDKKIQKFPAASIQQIAFFSGEEDKSIEVEYDEEIFDIPKIILKDKELPCKVDQINPKLLVCPIKYNDFPPSEDGNLYEGTVFDACGNEVCHITLKCKIEESMETDVFMVYILPSILLVLIVAGIVGVCCYIKRKRNQKPKDGANGNNEANYDLLKESSAQNEN